MIHFSGSCSSWIAAAVKKPIACRSPAPLSPWEEHYRLGCRFGLTGTMAPRRTGEGCDDTAVFAAGGLYIGATGSAAAVPRGCATAKFLGGVGPPI